MAVFARNNKCKHCRVQTRCLPAKLSKRELNSHAQFVFPSTTLKPGEHLMRQGKHGNTLYALQSGLLKSYLTHASGEESVMAFYFAPSVFGWETLDQHQDSPAIMALDHSNVCEIPVNKLSKITLEHPEMQAQLLHLASRRIHHGNMALLRGSAQQRVVNFILQMHEQAELKNPQTPLYFLQKISRNDIANYLRITPETISRTLRQLQNENAIALIRRKLIVLDLEELKKKL